MKDERFDRQGRALQYIPKGAPDMGVGCYEFPCEVLAGETRKQALERYYKAQEASGRTAVKVLAAGAFFTIMYLLKGTL